MREVFRFKFFFNCISNDNMKKENETKMERPGTSHQVEKVEVFEVREHVPYQAEITRAPTTYDGESGQEYVSSWESAWKAICQLFNMLHHMIIAIVVFCLWEFALTASPNGSISNMQLHIVFAGTGVSNKHCLLNNYLRCCRHKTLFNI